MRLTDTATGRAAAAFALAATLTIAVPALMSPDAAFAQNVSCTACTHEVSYFKGKGGLIAKAAKNAEGETATEVTWVAQCGGVVRSGKLEANDDGIVSTLFDDDNNLACSTDDGRFRLGPVTDGGWFWITDDDNSAVGNLVDNDVLGNVATTLANAGEGVETAAGKGVTFVKETATGRVGILPNILPVKPVPPTRKCGFTGAPSPGAKTSAQRRVATNCRMGDGKAMVVFYGPVGPGGASAPLPNGTIVRPYSGGVDIFPALYMNGTGHFVADANGDPDLGWLGGTGLAGARDDTMRYDGYRGRAYVVLPSVGGGYFVIQNQTPTAYGVRISSSGWGNTISRAGAGTYCGTPEAPRNNTMEFVFLMRLRTPNAENRITPPVTTPVPPLPGTGVNVTYAARTTVRVICPSSSEAQALRKQGLMPESLFRAE